ncbi:unnamed protein product [Thelazia callipaeda]|uniref:X-box-binding protein 1 n=1 Tax=Thelazia callipaeda TaxID=103827 RepID=A0A0N5DC71_THECL|nr:unnamed protein product [Thelazia callipaeda]
MSLYILQSPVGTVPNYLSLARDRRSATAILPRYAPGRMQIMVQRSTKPPIQKIMCQPENRTKSQCSIEELLGLSSPLSQTVRKRERLTHLTPEEKQYRRKMKNRVAAQTARDRKKFRTNQLEEALRRLHQDNMKLREENKSLKMTCEDLKSENICLRDLVESKVKSELRSEAEISSSDDDVTTDINNFLSGDEMQEIIREICTEDEICPSSNSCPNKAAEDFEQFFAKILDEIDGHVTPPKSTEGSRTSRMDCATPNIIIAPEYLKRDPDSEPSSPTPTLDSTMDCINYDQASFHRNVKIPDDDNDSPGPLVFTEEHSFLSPVSSPSLSESLEDYHSENAYHFSPFTGSTDPMFCSPQNWDIDYD